MRVFIRSLGRARWEPNPVVIKELRGRMRGPRAFWVLTAFLVLLSAFSALLYWVTLTTTRFMPGPRTVIIGQSLFSGLMLFEMVLILFITPALTAGAISREHEVLTYEILMATPLRPSGIVLGKLIAALGYVFLLILAAVPLGSVFFLFGGVTLRDLLVAILILATTAVTFGTISLFWSALFRRTIRAVVAGYLTVALFLFGPYFLYMLHGLLRQQEPPRAWLVPSPLSALSSAIAPASPEGPGGLLAFLGFGIGSVPSDLTMLRPTWHFTLWFDGLLTALALAAAVLLVRPIGRRRLYRRALALGIGIVAFFALVTGLAFDRDDWRQLWHPQTAVRVPEPLVPPPPVIEERTIELEKPPPPPPIPQPEEGP